MSQIDNSAKVDRVVQLPDRPLNNSMVAANDNAWLTALSRENLMAESLLSKTDLIAPRQDLPTGLVLVAVLFIAAVSPLFFLAFSFG